MKKMSKFKSVLIVVIHTIVICHMLFCTWICIAITPYQDWALELMYVDEDKLAFLKMFCIFELLVNAILAAGARLYSKALFVAHLLLTQPYILYFCWLASI